LHGAELLRLGFSVDQVVHDYGDVCQSVTELAVEQESVISTDEFRTLNRCLDNAIADAVTSFARAHQNLINDQAKTLQDRLNSFGHEQRRLVDVAIKAYSAIKTGHVGFTGATGTLLVHALAWIIHEFSDAKAPLMVERRCETSELPMRGPLRE
jgi:hypothetical protein